MGIRGKFWRTLQVLYRKTISLVKIGGVKSYFIYIRQGVKQGCALSSTLYSIYMQLLINGLHDTGKGISVKTGKNKIIIPALLYAYDVMLLSETREGIKKANLNL